MDSKSWEIKLSPLDKRIKNFIQGYRQNIALLGDDTEEISYLLGNYLQLNKSEEIIYIYVTTIYAGKREFFKAIAFSLLSDYLHKEDTLDNLINCASSTLTYTTDFIKACLKKEKISSLDALEVINKFINESGGRCVLIVEEFLRLADLFEDFYQDFPKFVILQRNCMVVLTASSLKEAQKVLSGELNLLFGNFEKISLNENTSLDNFLYLKHLINPVLPSPFFLSFFVNILGSNIIYYDLIAPLIKNNYQPNDEENSIASVIEEVLCLKETYLFQRFAKRIDLIKSSLKDFTSAIKLLFSLSEGYLRKKELMSLEIYDSKEFSSRLQKILDLNYIENLGNIYKIKDSLFSFWLSHVFKLYFFTPILDPRRRTSIYRKKIREEMAIFKEEFFKDKMKKILQLFSSFKNDTVWISKNRYKLPLIERTKIISYPKKDFHLLVGEGKEIIFAGIKEKNANDDDVLDFIEKGTNIKGKKVRKIFISLDSLSPEARLIAKNNKLISWDVNEVNRLLNIYNRSIVACGTSGGQINI